MAKRSAPEGTRPLTSQALKSISDTLRPHLLDAVVLDLFSGTGRFGLSMLKEGAAFVTFVEKNRRLIDDLRMDGAEVFAVDVFQYLKRASSEGKKFNLVFADPPFPIWDETFSRNLFTSVSQVLTDGAIFLVQHPKRVIASSPIPGLLPWKKTQFGESLFSYFTYETGREK